MFEFFQSRLSDYVKETGLLDHAVQEGAVSPICVDGSAVVSSR